MSKPTTFIELVLTCGSWQEAQKIADALLEKRLVACVEMLDVQSKFHWQEHIDVAKEVKLIMKSVADNFDKIEQVVAKLHSYDTFVLQSIPLQQTSSEAAAWIEEIVHGRK